MKAVYLTSHGKPGSFEIVDLPDPEPGPKEAVVEVKACGLNRLDLWVEEGGLPIPVELPRIPGSEPAGVIAAVGSEVREWRVGDRVAVQSNLFCGGCEFCLVGCESLCLNGELLGVNRHGAFAEKVLVPEAALVPLPDTVSFETSAALTLGGSTALHMLTRRTEVKSGDWVLVIGAASGVGSSAVQIAKELGAYVIATGSTEEKRALALRLGALHAVDSTDENWPKRVRELTGKRGVDLVVEHVGGQVLERVFECVARGGTVVTCGATAGRKVTLNLWPFFVKEQKLVGSYGRTRRDLCDTLAWAAQGKLKPVIDRIYPLEEVPKAYKRLRDRSVLGKLVIRP